MDRRDRAGQVEMFQRDGSAVTCGFAFVPKTFDIFEGTEQIQQLVISRAISGLRIE